MANPPRQRLLIAGFAVLAALALGACGSSGPENGLTQDQSDKLVAALENLRDDVEARDCEGAAAKLDSIRDDIAALEDVNGEIRKGLEELADRTDSLLDSCEPEQETSSTTSSTTTESVPTTTETTTTEETDTSTDEEPEEPKPEPPEEEPPPTEPPGNAPPEPPGNSDGGFNPGDGGVPPGQERGPGASSGKGSTKVKPAKPGKGEEKKMKGPKSERAADERKIR